MASSRSFFVSIGAFIVLSLVSITSLFIKESTSLGNADSFMNNDVNSNVNIKEKVPKLDLNFQKQANKIITPEFENKSFKPIYLGNSVYFKR